MQRVSFSKERKGGGSAGGDGGGDGGTPGRSE